MEKESPENQQDMFVALLRKYPCLMDKSQVPAVKMAKNEAALDLIAEMEALFGQRLTTKSLFKKINNMKTKIKQKMDLNKSGNKKIRLKDWEKQFLDFLQCKNNSTFSEVPELVSVGISKPIILEPLLENSESTSSDESLDLPALTPFSIISKKRKMLTLLELAETDDTRRLSNNELQRLILLEQYALIKMKQAKYMKKPGDTTGSLKKKKY